MPDPTRDVFSAAFLLAFASLFHFAGILILTLLILSLIVFGTFSIRMLFVSAAGIISVYLYLFLYYFLADKLEGQWYLYISWFTDIPQLSLNMGVVQYIIWGMMMSFFLDVLFYNATRMREWNIKIRKIILLNIYFAVIGFGSMVFLWDNLELAMLMISIPITIFIAGYLMLKRKVSLFLEIYIFCWYVMIFINNLLLAEC
jgi:hypothetical protein